MTVMTERFESERVVGVVAVETYWFIDSVNEPFMPQKVVDPAAGRPGSCHTEMTDPAIPFVGLIQGRGSVTEYATRIIVAVCGRMEGIGPYVCFVHPVLVMKVLPGRMTGLSLVG